MGEAISTLKERLPRYPGFDTASKNTRPTQPAVTRNDTFFALLFLIAGVFPTEYFVSIEPLRFLFIWVILSEEVDGFWQRFIHALKRWWPYLLIWLANALWLAYFYTLGGYGSYDVEVVREPLTLLQAFSLMGDAALESRVLYLGTGAGINLTGRCRSNFFVDLRINRHQFYFFSFLSQAT